MSKPPYYTDYELRQMRFNAEQIQKHVERLLEPNFPKTPFSIENRLSMIQQLIANIACTIRYEALVVSIEEHLEEDTAVFMTNDELKLLKPMIEKALAEIRNDPST